MSRSRCSAAALICAWMCAWITAALPARADEERPLLALLAYLRSDDADEREDAAAELREGGPDPRAVGPLVWAAKLETDHAALAEMLRALGESGALEALGVIQLHAQSPADDLRRAGRSALERWLRVNGVLGEEQELPDPPHAFYGPPPRFSPDRPAGRPLPALSVDPAEEPRESPAEPYYEEPPPGGVPPGFRFEEVPRRGLIIGGSVTFGVLYVATAIPGAMSLAEPGATTFLMVPVVGPAVLSAELFGHSGEWAGLSHIFGALLLVDAAGQLAGLSMLTAGIVATKPKLAPGAPQIAVSPGGAQLVWEL